MSICYSEEKVPFTGRPVPYLQQNANKHWLSHFSNQLMLEFMMKSPLSTFAEKRQAQKELAICERKLDHWRKHPNWNQAAIQDQVTALKKAWSK